MAGRRQWWALTMLVLPMVLISVDMTVLGFALPYLSADLGASGAEQLWIVDIYSFVLAGLLVLMGTVGDRIGRRRLLLIGAAVFMVGSIVAAYSVSPWMLIASRALMGIGGATLLPSTLSLIGTIFTNPHQRRIAVAVWGAGFPMGMALGPIVGGLLLEHFWWGSVFLVNVPILVLFFIFGPILLPEAKDENPRRFDVLSAGFLLATMLPTVYGIKLFAEHGFTISVAVSVLIGLVFGLTFVRRQKTMREPMIDLALFANRRFTVSIVTNLLGLIALIGLLFLIPQYLQLVLGLSPVTAALWMLPAAIAGGVGAFVAPQLAKRLSPAIAIGVGLLISVFGMVLLFFTGVESGLLAVVIGLALINGGITLSEAFTNDLIVVSAPKERNGAAMAISETAYELGAALGVATLGSVVNAVYRSTLPADVPEEARKTLGGAVSAADQLPVEASGQLLSQAREAFMNGIHIMTWLAAAVLLYAAIQAILFLRKPDKVESQKAHAGTPVG